MMGSQTGSNHREPRPYVLNPIAAAQQMFAGM